MFCGHRGQKGQWDYLCCLIGKRTHIHTPPHIPFQQAQFWGQQQLNLWHYPKSWLFSIVSKLFLEQFQAIFRNPLLAEARTVKPTKLPWRFVEVGCWERGGWGPWMRVGANEVFVGFRFRCFKWFRRKILVEMDVMVGEIGKNKIQLWPVDDPWAVHQVQFLTSIPCPARPQHMTVSWKRTGEYEAHWHHCNF